MNIKTKTFSALQKIGIFSPTPLKNTSDTVSPATKFCERVDPKFLDNPLAIKKWLKEMGVSIHPDKCEIVRDQEGDLAVRIKGDVFLSGKQMKQLPVKFELVTGYMDISNCGLESLQGTPRTVGGDFFANNNRLPTLLWGPEVVGGAYHVNCNKLEDMVGAPEQVLIMDCSFNQLKSMMGVPPIILQDLCCSNNPQLTKIGDCPKCVGREVILYRTPLQDAGEISNFEQLQQKYHQETAHAESLEIGNYVATPNNENQLSVKSYPLQ